VLLVGGAAASRAVREIAPAVLGRSVHVPPPDEYVARGAARQAAWVLAGSAEPPAWDLASTSVHEADPTPAVRERYAEARDRLLDRLTDP
jgi:xylulokinase